MIIEQIVIEWILAVLLLIFTILFFVYRKKYNSLKKNDSSEAPIPIQQTKNVVVHYFSEQSSDEIERKLSEVESLKNKINHLEKEKTFSKREQKERADRVREQYESEIHEIEKQFEKEKIELISTERAKADKELQEVEKKWSEKEKKLRDEIRELKEELTKTRATAPKEDNVAIQELEKKIHQLHADQKREKEKTRINFEAEKKKIIDAQTKAMATKEDEITFLRRMLDKQEEEINRLKQSKTNKKQ